MAMFGAGWCLLAVAASGSAAGLQQTVSATVLPAAGSTPEIAVFSLGKGHAADITRDGVRMHMGWDLPEVAGPGKRPLIVLSHGSGGNPWQHSDLAKQLVLAGFVVAAPFHSGDSSRDYGQSMLTTWTSWKLRPIQITATIDTMERSGRWSVRAHKVGVYGMSAGGHTALVMAGGQWSQNILRKHCNRHIWQDFHICSDGYGRLKGDWLDWLRVSKTLVGINRRLRDDALAGHTDARVAAVVAEVPAVAEFDMPTLVASQRAIGVVQALADEFVNPALHSGALLKACVRCVEVASVPGAGHLSFLSPEVPAEVSTDAPGFDRRVVAEVQTRVAAFFVRYLVDGGAKVGKK